MEDWNPKRPEAWAELFGFVVVPMFGPHAAQHPKGVHSLMLDGSQGSFVLSTAGPKQLINGPDPLRWAWSANVTHTVGVTDAEQAIVRRWDAPSISEKLLVHRASDARSLVRRFEHSARPPSPQSVIARGLKTFRAIRIAIEKQGGSSLDVVLAFNTVLAWVAQRSGTDGDIEIEFADAIRSVHAAGLVSFTPQQVSQGLRDYPIGDLARLLRSGDSTSEYLLDANLLIRHASGPLYQEAHKQLLLPIQPEPQQEFWPKEMLLVGDERPRALAPRFVHHTPARLARALVEVALRFLDGDGSLDVLDPACGSGVFLIEAVRQASIQKGIPLTVSLRGFDQSDIAVAMADFCVRNADPENAVHSVTIHPQNSLAIDNWGDPDLIAMNPPFVAWENLSQTDRDVVKRVLGTLHSGRPDLAFAFIVRGLKSLKPGGVMAALVPSSFLDGRSATAIRAYISQDGEFQVRLMGHFHDFDYFDATVEPSFIVVSRSTHEVPILIVTAKSGSADGAIRALRSGKAISRAGFELSTITKDQLLLDRWTLQTQRTLRFVDIIKTEESNTVADFFVPHTGIRTGKNPVFMLSENDLKRLCSSAMERQFFRPVADRIESGQIRPSGYVFYPYDSDGTLLLNTEQELRDSLPRYYEKRLQPAELILKNRLSLYRNWWELSEPRVTWLAAPLPRILSKYFGRAGNFAYDKQGKYAVVQGIGWSWKDGDPNDEIMLAYVGLINSSVFDEILSCFCPRVRGGQYNLSHRFIKGVPLPRLANHSARDFLTAIGRAITNGRNFDSKAQNELVLHSYGLSLSDLRHSGRTPLEKRMVEIGELRDGWFEPKSPRLDPGGLRNFEKFLNRLLAAGSLPTPYVYPTPEGNAQAEWSFPTWEVSAAVSLTSGMLHLHATHIDSDLSRDVETTLEAPGAVDALLEFMNEFMR